jgi:reactive intermediate/imine deaminase
MAGDRARVADRKRVRREAKPAILQWRIDAAETGRTVMPRQIITTANAPSSPLYSQGVKAGPHVFVSGMAGIDPGTGSLPGDTIQDQTRQALTNCQTILQAGGASLDDVIEVGILLTNPADFAGLNAEYARWFPSQPPTRYVAKLGVDLPGLLVSIRMTAFTT